MKYGVKIKIDVKKIDKKLLFSGATAVYLDATVFIDTEQKSEYGDHGIINQDISKEAREKGEKGNLLGNATVFWTGESQQGGGQQQQQSQPQAVPSSFDNFDDDIPF